MEPRRSPHQGSTTHACPVTSPPPHAPKVEAAKVSKEVRETVARRVCQVPILTINTSEDELEFHWTFVWHATPPTTVSMQASAAFPPNKAAGLRSNTVVMAKLGMKACTTFHKTSCTYHLYFLSPQSSTSVHPERFCHRKQYAATKN